MPKFFVKQPDGKFAVFSTVVDDFTYGAMSEDEMVKVATREFQLGDEDRESVLSKARRDEPVWGEQGQNDGLNRWRVALVGMAYQHGLDVIKERMAEMGLTEEAIPEEALEADKIRQAHRVASKL